MLVKLALDAVQTLDWSQPDLVSRNTRKFQPRMMLTLLGFCYASGIYGSDQIERAIRHHPTVRYICARTYPDQESIRQFRRENRALVEHCLTYILKQIWALLLDDGQVEFFGFQWLEETLLDQIQSEVCQRLDIVTYIDTMSNDD